MVTLSRRADQFPLRLPEGMRDLLRQKAEASYRSMNGEIVYRLEQSLAGDNEIGAAEAATSPRLNHSQSHEGADHDETEF